MIKRKVCVYLLKIDDQVKYVGITSKPLAKRVVEHESCAFKGNSHYIIHKAMRKYNNYKFEEFMTAFSKEDAANIEKELIIQFDTYMTNNGYNMTVGGEGCSQIVRSAEWRRKKSLSQKAKTPCMLGKKHTEESKRKMSDSKKGISLTYFKKPLRDNFGNFYDSTTDASHILNIKRSTIKESLRRERPLRCGRQFFYLEVDHS